MHPNLWLQPYFLFCYLQINLSTVAVSKCWFLNLISDLFTDCLNFLLLFWTKPASYSCLVSILFFTVHLTVDSNHNAPIYLPLLSCPLPCISVMHSESLRFVIVHTAKLFPCFSWAFSWILISFFLTSWYLVSSQYRDNWKGTILVVLHCIQIRFPIPLYFEFLYGSTPHI